MDIVGSRKIKERKLLQDKLKEYFDCLSKEYIEILASDISFTLGDEWQIVLKRPEESYNIISKIKTFLLELNISVYSGIGIGCISTDVYKNSSLMDGEAFIFAREAINAVKSRDHAIKSKLNKVYFKGKPFYLYNEFDNFDEVALTSLDDNILNIKTLNEVINVLIENTEILFSKITTKQLKVATMYEKFGSYNKMLENNVAKSKADISQKLNSAEYFTLKNNKELIKELLKQYIISN
nr:SatD family protein [Clostridium cibarium]